MNMIRGNALILLALMVTGCGSSEVVPEDIYPEDACAHCRMAISDPRFAAEIITPEREVFKFDDIGCMEAFQEHLSATTLFIFVRDFDNDQWLPLESSTIVRTGIMTPMGSGKLAFSSPASAEHFLSGHPARSTEADGNNHGRQQ
jgi:copper chaperone NosL